MQKQNTNWWLAVIGSGALLISAVGCQCPVQRIQTSTPGAVSDSPLIVDTAMQLREWDQSIAWYSNGDTPGHPILFLYESKPGIKNEYTYAVIETPAFILQGVAAPFLAFVTWPWSSVIYGGEEVPPTFTAMPPLPPSYTVTSESTPPSAEPAEATPATQPS
ncbi:MAG TPA: hypothetical protein VH518_17020 [Tepidisphaeraceae bacterium]|jgi:hypothetical protein